MKQIFTLLLALALINTNAQTTQKKSKQKAKTPVQNASAIKLQYDSTFIAGLDSVFEKPYKLAHDYILVEQDTVYPPEQLPPLVRACRSYQSPTIRFNFWPMQASSPASICSPFS